MTMSADHIAWLGITITVIGIIAGLFFAKQVRKRKQSQNVSGGSTAIQSGRDTKISK
jgi:H+/gluconate symporter-like permease